MAEKPIPDNVPEPVAAPDSSASPEPLREIEPLLGLQEFAQTRSLRRMTQAALSAWMRVHQHDPHGHYTATQWQDYLRRTLAHM